MNAYRKPQNRNEALREAALKEFAGLAPFVEGSLSRVKRRGCKQPGWHLTYKGKGRTHTLYVPITMAKEVEAWTREYRRLKTLIRKVTKQSRALIRRYVADQRAANRRRVWTSR